MYPNDFAKIGNIHSTMNGRSLCHATEKSEAIACVRMPVIPVNRVVDTKESTETLVGQGGGEAQGVADSKNESSQTGCL
jgi:hypothetical protein